MLELIRSNPEIVEVIVGALLALVLGGSARFWWYLKQLGGEQQAKLIAQRAIEQVGQVADERVRVAGKEDSPAKRVALAFKEAVNDVKTSVRVNTAMAPRETQKAVGDGVATVSKNKSTPRKVLGWLGRAAWWAAKKRAGF